MKDKGCSCERTLDLLEALLMEATDLYMLLLQLLEALCERVCDGQAIVVFIVAATF
jgi:hypothetical protein